MRVVDTVGESDQQLQQLLAEIRALRAENVGLRARLDVLERDVAASGAAREPAPADELPAMTHADGAASIAVARDVTSTTPAALSRRRALRAAGVIAASAAGLLAIDAMRSEDAGANNGQALTIGSTNTSTGATPLAVTQLGLPGVYGFGVVDKSLGAFPEKGALAGHTNGTYDAGVLGYTQSADDAGVLGIADGAGTGVIGRSVDGVGVNGVIPGGTGVGVQGDGDEGTGVGGSSYFGVGVYGTSVVGGAIKGELTSGGAADAILGTTNGSGASVHGQASGAGVGVFGEIVAKASTAAALHGKTNGSGPGVQASSAKGRGGVFSGKAAPIQLKASNLTGHPVDGQRGDLFVDAFGSLWYCRTSGNPATWVNLA